MTDGRNNQGPIASFREMAAFTVTKLPGWSVKLPLTILCGFIEVGIVVYLPLLGARIINALAAGNWDDFRRALVTLAILTFAQTIISFTNQYVLMRIEEQVGNRLRRAVVESVLAQNLRFFERHWVGDIVSRATNDTSALQGFPTKCLLQIFFDLVTLAIVIFILFRMNPSLAVLTIMAAPITLLYGHRMRRKMESAARRVRENMAEVTGQIQSWLSRPQAVKLHALEPVASSRFSVKNDELKANAVSFGSLTAVIGAVNTTLLAFPSVLIFAYGGYKTLGGELSVGELFAFMSYASYFNSPIQRLVRIIATTLPALYPVYERVREFTAGADRLDDDCDDARPRRVEAVRATSLTFAPGDEQGFRLSVPELTARRGEVIGIAGPNGSGKSTLARLLMGLYEPSAGLISFENEEGRKIEVRARRRLFSCLPQSPAVFDGTLLDNVTLFDPEPDLHRLSEIEVVTGLSDWVKSLPQGWQTQVNAGLATTLSGGQLQRIGLARLLYRDAPVLLLDEPSTSLDRSALPQLEATLEECRREHIVFLIAHSDSLLGMCDRIYRMSAAPDSPGAFDCMEDDMPARGFEATRADVAGAASSLKTVTAAIREVV